MQNLEVGKNERVLVIERRKKSSNKVMMRVKLRVNASRNTRQAWCAEALDSQIDNCVELRDSD